VQSDHWGGLPEIVAGVEVGELWYPAGRCDVPAFADFAAELAAAGTRLRPLLAADEPAAAGGGWQVDVLWPPSSDGACNANDRSLVIAVHFAGHAVLLTGDVEAGAELALARRRDRVAADVLKVPHHGSRSSSTAALLAAVDPRIAVASLGRDNRFGFPHAEVERRYLAHGVVLLRTDRDGAVSVAIGRDGLGVACVRRADCARVARAEGTRARP